MAPLAPGRLTAWGLAALLVYQWCLSPFCTFPGYDAALPVWSATSCHATMALETKLPCFPLSRPFKG